MKLTHIDEGNAFEWDKASEDYAAYRDIYPNEFYQYLLHHGLCVKGQNVLDLGTGTGVLPRHLHSYGASWSASDPSSNQIHYATILSQRAGIEDINYVVARSDEQVFEADYFDVVSACQCFVYFDHEKTAAQVHRVLKPKGTFVILYMAWLPDEDQIAYDSEALILKYNPTWSGCKEYAHPIAIPQAYLKQFTLLSNEVFPISVAFTRDSWHGRIRSCRGVDASMDEQTRAMFDKEHKDMLSKVPETFTIAHYAAIAILEAK